ncbi:MAG TPA: hypothetical protein PLL20_00385 [Phycisphaerae bacterium]|nr:hypothetical protein [Phycisphaerae bacterium]HRR83547.1 hypothetical protein [Phycisphaerae bacterium]
MTISVAKRNKQALPAVLKLTMQTYTDPQLLDTFGAVERLPELRPENQPKPNRKTGLTTMEAL